MTRPLAWSIAIAASALLFGTANAQPLQSHPGIARQLFEGCLKPPSEAGALLLASLVGAVRYSDARRRHEQPEDSTIVNPETGRDETQRTRTKVISFEGWDLPGQGAGVLEYVEDTNQIDFIQTSTGQAVTALKTSHDRTCRVQAPVQSARAMFELFESLTSEVYGVRISADRRWVDIFMFDEDRFDIELSLVLETPLKRVAPAPDSEGESRAVLPDGGPRVDSSTAPGIRSLALTREALLAGLDQPARMIFFNTSIEPVVQRLAEAR